MIYIGGSHDHRVSPDPGLEVYALPKREPVLSSLDLTSAEMEAFVIEHYLRTTIGFHGSPDIVFYRHESLSPVQALQLLLEYYGRNP